MTEFFSLPYENKKPEISATAFIAPTAVIVGDVAIGEESGIWYGCVVRGDVNDIKIGARTNIQDGTVIHVATHGQGTYIGDDVTVGHMAMLHACTIEDWGFVGMKACAMDGAVIESWGMLAAGGLLTPGKKIASGELWAGNPAKFLRRLTDTDFEMFRWSAAHYVELAQIHRQGSGV
ncbi:MAG: gamma carbonic anhydrase family protein [Alphaproteobacteria bacterium]